MLRDRYNRPINYLRVSVTDRCNLSCVYCRPHKNIPLMARNRILSFEEITDFIVIAADFGFDRIRLTGGEPLVRKDIISLVSMVSHIEAIRDLSMTTNGILLETFAPQLRQAGLDRLNISLDTLNPRKYREITCGGDVRCVLEGIDCAIEQGFHTIKLNCVINRSSEEEDARQVKKFAETKGLQIRYIRKMSLTDGTFWSVQGGKGGICSVCNRIRLTSDGYVLPCLFSNISYNCRELGPEQAIRLAIKTKPQFGINRQEPDFARIGG